MGAWLGRRTEPRVDFRESVRVIWPGEVSGVVARAVNLSSTGILVDAPTPTPCPVGSDVLCDVALPRGPRLLRGRVAHRRVLPSAKVGMGIEFVDLSPREAAELRTVIDEIDEEKQGEEKQGEGKPQRVKVRFRGTNHVVRARAVPTADGFRLVTALPFLKLDTEVDIALSPDASVSARGWVSQVTLEPGEADGAPRLRIDVSVKQPEPWRVRSSDPSSDALTPVVETLVEAVPEHVWEPEELGVSTERASLDGPVELAAHEVTHEATYEVTYEAFQDDESEPTHVDTIASGPSLPTIREASGATPSTIREASGATPSTIREASGATPSTIREASGAMPLVEESDLTEIVTLAPRRSPWRALGGGMVAGTIVLAAFVGALILVKALGSKTPAPAAPVVVAASPAPVAVSPPVAAPPVVAAPQAPAAPIAVAPEPEAAPVKAEAEPAPAPATFTVGLTGSLAGSARYPLRDPDGVAFNLPHARATMKLGTYRPDVPGLKMVWVRALPGGGAHLRFFFSSSSPPPRVDLTRDAVRVAAR
jgi:hypothetical protein